MLITYGSPGARLQHLQLQGAPWASLQVYCLVKGSDASNGCAVTPVLPALIQGPFPASDEVSPLPLPEDMYHPLWNTLSSPCPTAER
jgi:hypothetical protein